MVTWPEAVTADGATFTVTGKVIGWVTPWRVSSPVTSCVAPGSAFLVMLLLLKVALGNFSTSRKSAVLMWPASLGSSASTDAVSISTTTECRSSPTTVAAPLNCLKAPLWLLVILEATKSNLLWAGSSASVFRLSGSIALGVAAGSAAVAGPADAGCSDLHAPPDAAVASKKMQI